MASRTFRQLMAAIFFLLALLSLARGDCDMAEDQKAEDFISGMDAFYKLKYREYKESIWYYFTHLTAANAHLMFNTTSDFIPALRREAAKGVSISADNICSNDTRARFARKYKQRLPGSSAQEGRSTLTDRVNLVKSHIFDVCARAEVCLDGTPAQCLSLVPGITEKMATSRDPDELLRVWKGWRDATGRQVRDNYTELIDIYQSMANRSKNAVMGLYPYDRTNRTRFIQTLNDLMEQVMPLYRQLQVFVRGRLETVYPRPNLFKPKLIPAHLLGNLFGDDWTNLQQHLLPFPSKGVVDITAQLRRKNYSVLRMFQTSEAFFTSLGLRPMTDEFWSKSMLEKPADGRLVSCNPMVNDFDDGRDFRIRMCATVNRESFFTILREMGYIQQAMQNSQLPEPKRGFPNQGMSDAIGYTLGLSAGTTTHLKVIGLLDQGFAEDEETDLNHLTTVALAKLPFASFFYVADRYRREMWSRQVPVDSYNRHWWDLRCKYQGVVPPVERTEQDFDAVAHPQMQEMMLDTTRHFVGTVLQFQFYELLCNASGHTGPLFKCDFYGNAAAGTKLREMLSLGKTKTMQETLELFTGSPEIDVRPMLRYFRPLMDHLETLNGDSLEWDDQCQTVLDSLIRPTPS